MYHTRLDLMVRRSVSVFFIFILLSMEHKNCSRSISQCFAQFRINERNIIKKFSSIAKIKIDFDLDTFLSFLPTY